VIRRTRLSPSGGYAGWPILNVTEGPLAGRRIVVDSALVLGRENSDIDLADLQVSRRHAELRRRHGGLEIEDLGSANGTWVNGERIEEPVRIEPGNVIRVGGTALELERPPSPPGLSLLFREGPLEGSRVTVAGELVLGREGADVEIDDLEISRRHTMLRATAGGLEVEDLKSRNGTWVNTERIHGPRTLQAGDVVRLGRTTLVLEAEAGGSDDYGAVESLLARLAGVVSRRRGLTIGIWVVLLLAGSWFSLHQADRLSSGGWEVPGSESKRADDLIERFPLVPRSELSVLVSGRSAQAVRARLAEVRREVRAVGEVRPGDARLFESGTVALLPLSYTGEPTREVDTATELRDALVETSETSETRVVGIPAVWSDFEEVAKEQLAKSELIGFPLILLILVAAFGTLVAAASPLALGFVTVFLGGAIIYGVSRVAEMSIYVTNMASMIGIGVAVDYSLFVVSHFRRELEAGQARDVALRRALASSGTAVVFSGVTVALALAGLFLISVNAIRSMAVGAIIVVLIAVLASVTLLPAFLALVGGGIERFRVRLPWSTGEEGRARFWTDWTRKVLAHPGRSLLLASGIMLALASPVLAIDTASRGLEQLPPDSEVRQATERAIRLTGPGATGPANVIVSARGAAEELSERLGSFPGIHEAGAPVASADGQLFLVSTVFDSGPESDRAAETLERVQRAAELIAASHGATAVVGGATAEAQDSERAIIGALWKVIVFVLALSYVVLLVLLRSVLMPLKAVAMNLLSVGAAYGVLVAVFQWGVLDWTGYESPGYIDTIVPPLLLAVTFGLSMDYEVFLLTRIRERYQRHGSNEEAVTEGVVESARVITSAALIMVAVFGAFAIAGATSVKQLGVGLAVAILLDATLVRLVIVPSTMRLLGDWNWWMPAPLTRLLPAASSGEA
jgi:RND superfamily putative drug exporter